VPVTGGDFEYAWKRVLDPFTGSGSASLLLDIKGARAFHQSEVSDSDSVGVRALDDFTLVVELEGPASYFLHLLTYNVTYPIPRHVVETYGAAWTEIGKIVTNGSFRLEAWNQGESMILVRNPEYHGRFTGNLQRVELSFLPAEEWCAFLAMYEADVLDTLDISLFPPEELEDARHRHAGGYFSVPMLTTAYFGFNVRRPPFDDVRVRQAFVMAIDRETWTGVWGRGHESPATGGFVPPGMPGHSAGIGLPYDPDRARQLLAEAGYPGGQGFPIVDLLLPSNPQAPVVAEYLQAHWWENLEVEITWEAMEREMLLRRVRRKPPHIFNSSWTADYPDPDNFLRVGFPWKMTGWRNEVYDRLVEEAKRVMDQGERMRLYGQADRILVEEAPIFLAIYKLAHLLVKPWVKKHPALPHYRWFLKDVIIEPH